MRLVHQKSIGLTTLRGENAVSPSKNHPTNKMNHSLHIVFVGRKCYLVKNFGIFRKSWKTENTVSRHCS